MTFVVVPSLTLAFTNDQCDESLFRNRCLLRAINIFWKVINKVQYRHIYHDQLYATLLYIMFYRLQKDEEHRKF